MARIAALVVAYHSYDEIVALLDSFAAASDGRHEIDVHVIENSGDRGEMDKLAALPGITFVANEKNLGYGGGMNALVASLTEIYDWYLVCNPDIRFSPGSIDELLAADARHPSAGLFGPRLRGEDGLVYPSARAFPSIRTGIGHALLANIWAGNPWTRKYHRSGGAAQNTDTEVDWLSGACLLVRPEAFHAVDGFDEGYFMYFEDVDLGWRLSKLGYTAMYIPSAEIVHSGAHSTSRQASFMRTVHHQSAARYLTRKYSAWYLAPLRVGLRVALYLRREFFRYGNSRQG